jgi:AhpD family alkylhydroperoxidase
MAEEYWTIAPEAYRGLLQVNRSLKDGALPAKLVHLVYLRASQLNGCAYCCDMHTHEAIKDGESEQRLHCLAAWRDAPFFDEKERAALAWTEVLTRLADRPVPDELHAEVRLALSEREFVELTFAVASINAFNRLSVGTQRQPKPR